MAGQTQGFQTQLAINGQAMEFLTIRGGQTTELVDNTDNAIRGILDHPKERVTQGLKRNQLEIVMEPSPSELDVLLPLIGMAESPPDTFTLTDDFSGLTFTTIVDRSEHVHTYAGCLVDKAVFRGQMGNRPIRLELTIVGKTEAEGASGSFSATALDTDHNYAFYEGVLTLEGSARSFDRFALGIENNVFASFNNSQTAETICPTNRNIWLACSSPYDDDENDLYTSGIADAGGAAGSIAFTRSTKSSSFAFANLKLIGRPPDILGKTEVRLDQYYRAYKSGSTAALIVTHDNTA